MAISVIGIALHSDQCLAGRAPRPLTANDIGQRTASRPFVAIIELNPGRGYTFRLGHFRPPYYFVDFGADCIHDVHHRKSPRPRRHPPASRPARGASLTWRP